MGLMSFCLHSLRSMNCELLHVHQLVLLCLMEHLGFDKTLAKSSLDILTWLSWKWLSSESNARECSCVQNGQSPLHHIS